MATEFPITVRTHEISTPMGSIIAGLAELQKWQRLDVPQWVEDWLRETDHGLWQIIQYLEDGGQIWPV